MARTCFQKYVLLLVCGMAGTSKPRHLCAWPGVPSQGPPQASGAPTEITTLPLAQVLCGTGAKSWLPHSMGLVCDTACKTPCQARQLVSPFTHTLSPRLSVSLCSLKYRSLNSINSAPGSSAEPFISKPPQTHLL